MGRYASGEVKMSCVKLELASSVAWIFSGVIFFGNICLHPYCKLLPRTNDCKKLSELHKLKLLGLAVWGAGFPWLLGHHAKTQNDL